MSIDPGLDDALFAIDEFARASVAPHGTVGGDAGTAPWSLSRIQVVNWGGFDGHHSVDVDHGITLLTGPSGTGKSTLLDAIIGVLMDSSVPFNGASNEATGRARGRAQRNIVSYMRGKLADTISDDDGSVAVLRGKDRPTWSAIGLTWTNAAGAAFSAFRAYYAGPSARTDPDLVREYYTAPFDFDLSMLEPYARNRFNKREVKAAFASITPHGDSYTSLAADLSARLGIGDGRDRKALHLLARVQRGGSMSSVDQLFRDFVLSTPSTFDRANDALTSFEAMRDAHATMETARRKAERLANIARQHAEMTQAAAAVARNDAFRVDDPDSPFALWSHTVRAHVLDETERALAVQRRDLTETIREATERSTYLRTQANQARDAFRDAGGGAIELLTARVEQAELAHRQTQLARSGLDSACALLGLTVTTAADFAAARSAPEHTREALQSRVNALMDRNNTTYAQLDRARARRSELETDIRYYKQRRDLIRRDLADQRTQIAETLGLQPSDLPFVAELIDMREEYEDWRTATELALGGWALNVLVPDGHAAAFRRAANPRNWPARLRWQTVDLRTPAPGALGDARLPGRLRVRTGPFHDLVVAELVRQFDLVCVDDVAELDAISRGLTITGQTRAGGRGAHGGTASHRPVIGFSNERLLERLRKDWAAVNEEVSGLETELGLIQDDIGTVNGKAGAIDIVRASSWEAVDTDASAEASQQARDDLEKARTELGGLDVLEKRATQLSEKADKAAGERETAERTKVTVDVAWESVVTAKDAAESRRYSLASRIGELADDVATHLAALLAKAVVDPVTPENVIAYLSRVRTAVNDSTRSEKRTRDNLADALRDTFKTFNEEWPDNNRGTDPHQDYPSYAAILDELASGGLGALADDFRVQVTKWSSEDLLLLHEAFRTSRDEIRARLHPINQVLATLGFGRDHRRLSIDMADTPSRDVQEFRRELTELASGTTTISDGAEAERRFARIAALMAHLDRANKATRDALLDVRRHIHVQAIQHNPDPLPDQRFDTLGEQSGGESQELIAFILGAALRYQLGDAYSDGPAYRTVVLDEAFIKADPQFLGRGIAAWQQLGFQLVIGAPVDKFTALEPYTDTVWVTRKADDGTSTIDAVTRIHGGDARAEADDTGIEHAADDDDPPGDG